MNAAATKKTPAAIYARFSTDRQDARSIEDQTRRCRRFAEDRGYVVVDVFSDAAQSGASLQRAGLQALLAETRNGRRSRFRAVLVDDLSRLSRDLGDTWNLVFGDLAGEGVTVVDVTSGLGSDNAAARITFGALALVNDMARQSARTQTRRGLEGRALASFHTGGRCYGYRTEPEPSPPDPLHPRAVQRVDDEEAGIVRRIFSTYVAGAGLREIARGLNREHIPAPYDKKAYAKPAGRGWSHLTVFAVLRNERYIGRVVWNKRRWERSGSARRRRPLENDRRDWVVTERPDLAIIERDLWDRVQERIAERSAEGRKLPRVRVGHDPSPLSHLLVCGACRNRMSIAGGSKKGSRRWKCSANHSKGPEICANAQSISDAKVMTALAETLRQTLTEPRYYKHLAESVRALWPVVVGGRYTAAAPDLLDEEIRRQDAKVDRLAMLVAGNGDIEALLRRLRTEEAALKDLRARRAAPTAPGPRRAAPTLPSPERLRELWEDLDGTLRASPREAQQALRARLGGVVLTPQPDGATYLLRTAVKMEPAALVAGGRRVGSTGGCGGADRAVERTVCQRLGEKRNIHQKATLLSGSMKPSSWFCSPSPIWTSVAYTRAPSRYTWTPVSGVPVSVPVHPNRIFWNRRIMSRSATLTFPCRTSSIAISHREFTSTSRAANGKT